MTLDDAFRTRIKQAIIDSLGLEGLTPESIADDAPLFGDEGLGLDSVDALELMVVFEKDFGITIDTEDIVPGTFDSVASIEKLIQSLGAAAEV